ncbi:MAG: nucleotidyltransferase family protein [Desulfuromonadales bacterium]
MSSPTSQNSIIPASFSLLCKILSPWTSDTDHAIVKEAINNSALDWQKLTEYANRANLTPALRYALSEKGLWETVPPELQEYLDAMHQFNTERNEAIFQHLGRLIQILNKAGITPLLIKGGAALATGLYPDPAIRFMMDLDILVPENVLMQSVSALEKQGYYVPEANLTTNPNFNPETCKHYLPLVHDDETAHVELHRTLLSDDQAALLPTEHVWRDALLCKSGQMKEVSFFIMSPTHQILHSIIHSEISHANYKAERLELRQLLHFAYLCKRHTDSTDWQQVQSQMNYEKTSQALRAYLYSAEMLLGVVTSFALEPDAEAKLHFSKMILGNVEGKYYISRMISGEVAHIKEAFSKQGLLLRLPRLNHCSVGWLRLRYIMVLINRYSTVEKLKGYFARKIHSLISTG